MIKRLLSLFVFGLGLFFVVSGVEAAGLVTVDSDGEIIVNVLSVEDFGGLEITKPKSLKVVDGAIGDGEAGARLSLVRDGDKVRLSVIGDDGRKELDVTDYEGDLVEIEERAKASRVRIASEGGRFVIGQQGVVAVTDYPINIDTETAEISLSAPSGARFLYILPKEAVQGALRARVLTSVGPEPVLEVYEKEGKELLYVVVGEKRVNLFDVLAFSVPVSVEVNASTGEIVFVEQPSWLRVFGFLFG